MDVYPIFLVGLEARRCLVIGGDAEAERKVAGLLDSNAAVTVISATLTEQLHTWVHQGTLTWIARGYEPGDLQDAWLVIATEREAAMIAQLWEEAQAGGVLLNVVDDVAHSTFVAGSVVRQGPLTMSISTSGYAPTLAVRLRRQLEQEFGPEYAAFLELLRELRKPLAAHYPSLQERRALWARLLDSDILDLLRANQPDLARQLAAILVGIEEATESQDHPQST
jgi:precorrin-2 dehydrogenase / sirohydrochlorin ferrochelatase